MIQNFQFNAMNRQSLEKKQKNCNIKKNLEKLLAGYL